MSKKKEEQFVYLFERVSGREWKTIFQFKREIKIGVSKNPLERLKTVNSGIKGKVVFLTSIHHSEPYDFETFLHNQFSQYRFTVKNAKKGSGATEFFRLSSYQISRLDIRMKQESGENAMWSILLLILIILVVTAHIFYYGF